MSYKNTHESCGPGLIWVASLKASKKNTTKTVKSLYTVAWECPRPTIKHCQFGDKKKVEKFRRKKSLLT